MFQNYEPHLYFSLALLPLRGGDEGGGGGGGVFFI